MSNSINFISPLVKFDSNLWSYHIKVPDPIAESFVQENDRRVICVFNSVIRVQSALMPSPEGWFLLVNKELRNKLGIKPGMEVSVSLTRDNSEYGMDMPEELSVLLDQDEEGNHYFQSLTPGKQRNLIYIVAKVKNTRSRLNKALAIMDHLKFVKGKLDFKLLNQTIKEYNNR